MTGTKRPLRSFSSILQMQRRLPEAKRLQEAKRLPQADNNPHGAREIPRPGSFFMRRIKNNE